MYVKWNILENTKKMRPTATIYLQLFRNEHSEKDHSKMKVAIKISPQKIPYSHSFISVA
jgi:hypothetical protein